MFQASLNIFFLFVSTEKTTTSKRQTSNDVLSEESGWKARSLRVREVRSVGDVRGDRGAPAEHSVRASSGASSGRGSAQRLGAVPQGHQAGAPHHQPSSVHSLRSRWDGGRRGRRRGREQSQGLGGGAGGKVVGEEMRVCRRRSSSLLLSLPVQLRSALVMVVLRQLVPAVMGGRGGGAGRVVHGPQAVGRGVGSARAPAGDRRPPVAPVVALLGMGLGGDAGEGQAAEAQAEALGVEGLDLRRLALQKGPDALRALVLQGQHLLLDLEKQRHGNCF